MVLLYFHIRNILLFSSFFCLTATGLSARVPIVLEHESQNYYVVRKVVEYFVDSSNHYTARQLYRSGGFHNPDPKVADFVNSHHEYTYWLRFSVVNQTESGEYRLELFDHDIDDVMLYYEHQGAVHELHSGYSVPFHNRDLYHKNIGFLLSLPMNDTITYLLKFKSHKTNVLEPVIRSIPAFYRYSIIEYMLLGFFYGFTGIIILYNLVYYFILRKREYLFYLIYMTSITLYLMSGNGTGFQLLWPELPQINYYAEVIFSTIGIGFLLLFTGAHLNLKTISKPAARTLLILVVLHLAAIPLYLLYIPDSWHTILSVILVQVAFVVTMAALRKGNDPRKWFVCGFILLNSGLIISWLEGLNFIPSSIFTVYSLYLAINLQFICISIGLVQDIRLLNEEKNTALRHLLDMSDKNQMMRILALKKQMSPHFIFNSLNSILQRILSGNKQEASDYLVKFSRLIRNTLEHSDILYCTLSDELESLRLYLSLEAMRLGNSFSYHIEVDAGVQISQEEIPNFILQPFVENSIWHGLMPMDGEKNLWIRIRKINDVLLISIEDNGIGREQSAQLKKDFHAASHGMRLITERLELLNKKYKSFSEITVSDLYTDGRANRGTKVIITIQRKDA